MANDFSTRLAARLRDYKAGKLSESEIVNFIKASEFEDVGFARIDHKRSIFKNFPEVIFGPGKTDAQVVEIFKKMAAHGGNVMATRTTKAAYDTVKKSFPKTVRDDHSSMMYLRQGPQSGPYGSVVVMTAGTSDIKVAEEAALTAELSGSKVTRVYDVGVAGIKRLFNNLDHIFNARAIVVAAGMEGALASVVGGLSPVPVIAVPTSIGYGASFQGVAALLSMLNCCSPGIAVVNIDNGFGAGFLAAQINRQSSSGDGAGRISNNDENIPAASKAGARKKGAKKDNSVKVRRRA